MKLFGITICSIFLIVLLSTNQIVNAQPIKPATSHFILKLDISKKGFTFDYSPAVKMRPVQLNFNFKKSVQTPKNSFPIKKHKFEASRWQTLRQFHKIQHKLFNEVILNKKRLNLA